MVTPFGASVAWVSAYLDGLASGESDTEAREGASRLAGVKGKEFARCRISTLTLTVPVEGGAGVLKHRGADPVLSEHGKWRREHLGALNAAYGRTPYYEHLMPQIEEIYKNSEGIRLEEFNRRLLDVALGWLTPMPDAAERERLKGVIGEKRRETDCALSIFDVLFRLGKEGVFAL